MRVEFLPSIDFNQMLVYSTFVHLLFLTWLMFLPDPKTQEQIVVPTFRLDLIELSPKAKPTSLALLSGLQDSFTSGGCLFIIRKQMFVLNRKDQL